MGSIFYKITKAFIRGYCALFYPFELENGDCVPEDKGYIICSNHLSKMDPIFISVTQNRHIHYMAKKELFDNKLLGALISRLGAFPVDRGQDGGKAINTAQEIIKNGDCIGVFIEGTRSKTGKLGRGHMGALLIAKQVNATVIPCCITGKKTFIKPFNKTKITYGAPLTPEELGLDSDDRRALRNAANTVMEKIGELRAEHEAQFEAAKKKKKKDK